MIQITIPTNYAPVEIAGALSPLEFSEIATGYFALFAQKQSEEARAICVAKTVGTAIKSLYILPKKQVAPSTLSLELLAASLADALTVGDLEYIMDRAAQMQKQKNKLDSYETLQETQTEP